MSNVDSLWQRYKAKGDLQAREQIIGEFAYLTKYVVDRLNVRPTAALGCDDLLSYAIVGLIEAVERFDPARDIKFSTFAVPRIRGSVLDAMKSMDWQPRSVRSKCREMRNAMAGLEAEFGRPPTDEETARAMGINEDELCDILADSAQAAALSLEELMLGGEESEAGFDGDPVFAAEMEERMEILARVVGELPEKERLVISLYYKDELTLKEVAEVLGVTESRACQIHSKAVNRMQGKLMRHADLMIAA